MDGMKNSVYADMEDSERQVADSKRINKKEYFHYVKAYYLTDFNKGRFVKLIEKGKIVVDM